MELATASLIIDQSDRATEAEKRLTLADLRVWCALLERLEETNRIVVSQKTVAKRLGMTPQAVSRSIRKLIELGWVHRVELNVWRLDVDLGWNGKEIDRWQEAGRAGKRRHLRPVETD